MVDGYCNTITDYASNNGATPLLFSIRDCVPFAFEGLLIGLFLLFFAGNYFLIKQKTGKAKILVPLLSSSLILIPLSSLLALAQLVTFVSVLFWAFMAIIWFILFLVSDDN